MDLPSAREENENGGISAASAAPLYTAAQRWRTYLLKHSAPFRALQEERERGWKSPALDTWYARRGEPSTTAAAAAAVVSSSKSVQPPSGSGSASSFVTADVRQLAERYRKHMQRITQASAPAVFAPAFRRESQSASHSLSIAASSSDGRCGEGQARDCDDRVISPPLPRTFLDLGCAPGGVSKYLVRDLGWRGTGVSLADSSGGIAVDTALLEDGEAFCLLDGDVTQPPETWRRSAAYHQHDLSPDHNGGGCGSDGSAVAKGSRYFFVNGGAVLDHGQRQMWAAALHEAQSSASLAGADAMQNPLHCILPWFSLLVPQLRVALDHVEDGGAIMAVHGAPHCASLFILLKSMESPLGLNAGAASRTSSVHVLETMHLAKPPVYVLWTGVGVGGKAAARTAARRRLFDALCPSHPRLSPIDDAAPTPASTAATAAAAASLLQEKQKFWLGESDEGFRLAVEGFEQYRHLMEPLWRRVEVFLRGRRERAEREMPPLKRSKEEPVTRSKRTQK